MTRLVEALKKVGQTFELFRRGEIGPCESTPSPVQIPNLVPSTFCRVPVEEKHITRGLIGMFFEFDKTFLLPSATSSLQALKRFYKNDPGGELLIVGHTDTKGPPDYNLDLSKRRAKNVVAYLEHDVETWLAYYQPQPVSKQWGTREDQYMLSALPEDGEKFYTGKVDGIAGPRTKEAITKFQKFSNAQKDKQKDKNDNHSPKLTEDGIAGPDTRRELIKAYMERGGKRLPKGTPLFSQGCGEFHPEVPTGDEVEEPRNRRVEVFFFPDKIDPPMPVGGCRAPGCIEYPQWRNRATRTIDFTKKLADLTVKVQSKKTSKPLAGATVKVSGPSVQSDTTDTSGVAHFSCIVPGNYLITAQSEGYESASATVLVGGGDAQVNGSQQAFTEMDELTGAPFSGATQTTIALTKTPVILSVELVMFFASKAQPNKTRWENRTVPNATVEIIDPDPYEQFYAKGTSSNKGVAKLTLNQEEIGWFKLKVTPPPGKESHGLAGPLTASADQNEVDFRWRPFEMDIEIGPDGLRVNSLPAGETTVGSPPHAMVADVQKTKLRIDWRPDWIMRKNKPGDKEGWKILFPRPNPKNIWLPDLLVLHQTGWPERIGNAINTLTGKKQSAHYLVDTDGHVIKMVHEANKASHVGGGNFWQWQHSINERSVGIEILHADGGDGMTPHPFTEEQYTSLKRLIKEIMLTFMIHPVRVVGHSDVEPRGGKDRKDDPGLMFEWQKLEDAGLARSRNLEVEIDEQPYGVSDSNKLKEGDSGTKVEKLKEDLRAIGYNVDVNSTFDPYTKWAVERFQRRFYARNSEGATGYIGMFPPAAVVGKVDLDTARSIKQVLAYDWFPYIIKPSVAIGAALAPIQNQQSNFAYGEAQPLIFEESQQSVTTAASSKFVIEGDKLDISWTVTGVYDLVLLDPPSTDVTKLTRDGNGKAGVRVTVKNALAKDGVITYTLHAEGPGGTDFAKVKVFMIHTIPADPLPGEFTASIFMEILKNKGLDVPKIAKREEEAVKRLLAGYVPRFLRRFVPIYTNFKGHQGVIFVSPDYVSIGADHDFIRFPLTPIAGQKVVDKFSCTFPTAKIVNEIWDYAGKQGKQIPFHHISNWETNIPPKPSMEQMNYNKDYIESNERSKNDGAAGGPLLYAGHKKDVILSWKLRTKPKYVVIHGAFHNNKWPLEKEQNAHGDSWVDYSHGVRLVSQNMIVNNEPAPLLKVLRNKELCGLVTDIIPWNADEDFPQKFPQRYPGT